MRSFLLKFASFSGAMCVILGAFAAHYLKNHLPLNLLQAFETGVKYQMYHSLCLLFIYIVYDYKYLKNNVLYYSSYFFIIGIILFSGSLYFLSLKSLFAISGITWISAITPIGGICFILGWCLLFFSLKTKE